jgi:membrane protease YdiL (CAAX protease family)
MKNGLPPVEPPAPPLPADAHGEPRHTLPADALPAGRDTARAYLLSFRTGRWRWPWAVLATLIGVLAAVAMMIGASALFPASIDAKPEASSLLRPGELADYLVILVAWTLLAVAALVALRLVKGDRPGLAFTATGTFYWSDFAKTATAIILAFAASYALTYVITPKDFAMPARDNGFYGWLAFGVIVIFIQSGAEEIYFRGFLFRVWGAVIPYAWLAAGLIMSVFIALHIPNPDVQRDVWMALITFVSGEILAYWVLMRTKCLAASWGLHWANNAFQFFLVAAEPMGDPDAAIFVYTDPVYAAGGSRLTDPLSHLMTVAGLLALVAMLFWRRSPLYLPKRAAAMPDAG